MTTKNAPKRAGRKVSDVEVKTAEHDELLMWLLDAWPSVATERWAPTASTLSQWHEDAKADAREWTDQTYQRFKLFIDDPARELPYAEMMDDLFTMDSSGAVKAHREPEIASAKARRTFSQAAPFRDAVIEKLSESREIEIPTPHLEVVSCEVMRPVEAENSRQSWGFVDMSSRLKRISGLRFMAGSCAMSHRVRHDSSLTERAESLLPDAIRLAAQSEEIEVWCTIRSGSFTLGEVLQELKTLRELGGRRHETALVVEQINPVMRSTVEREGFPVIERRGNSDQRT